ncbi:hypothetical protein BSF38_05390 [Paludisphaera borealis]|uniref:Uncharacterized protein n=1 Tax=Paludisphaera borealis TaxID=1387353 RepID=A0A1U7CY48_9BACT|nr:hypothetical protein BSF38_05390 [Paludisphaera borealis]
MTAAVGLPARLGVGALVAIGVGAAFLPIVFNDWVFYDDPSNFLENLDFRGLSPTHLLWALTTLHMGVYQPLAWILFEAEYAVFGLLAWGYHLVSLVLHLLNALVLARLIAVVVDLLPSSVGRRPGVSFYAAATSALVFAVHPLRVEVVAWASCQPYLPSALFAMTSTLAYLRSGSPARIGRGGWLAVSWFLYFASLACKAIALPLPIVFLILDAYPLRRFSRPGRPWRAAIVEKLPFVAIGLLFLTAAVVGKYVAYPVEATGGVGVPRRLLEAGYSAWFYVEKTGRPSSLAALYESPDATSDGNRGLVIAVAAVIAITTFAIVVRRRSPGLLAAWAAYLVLLAPVSGFFRSGFWITADRYAYLSTIPLYVALAYGLTRLWSAPGPGFSKFVAWAAPAVAVVALGAASWRQCQTWRDSEAMMAQAIRAGTISRARHLTAIGAIREQQRRPAEAESCYREAVRVDPSFPEANYGLGMLVAKARPDEGLKLLERSLAEDPKSPRAHMAIGMVLVDQNRFVEAAGHFESALRLYPYYIEARFNLAYTLDRQGKREEAATEYERVLRSDPRNFRAQRNLTILLEEMQRNPSGVALPGS